MKGELLKGKHLLSHVQNLLKAQENLGNDVIALKTYQMFSFHNTLEKFENATVDDLFGLFFVYEYAPFHNVFRPRLNAKRGCFQICPV